MASASMIGVGVGNSNCVEADAVGEGLGVALPARMRRRSCGETRRGSGAGIWSPFLFMTQARVERLTASPSGSGGGVAAASSGSVGVAASSEGVAADVAQLNKPDMEN